MYYLIFTFCCRSWNNKLCHVKLFSHSCDERANRGNRCGLGCMSQCPLVSTQRSSSSGFFFPVIQNGCCSNPLWSITTELWEQTCQLSLREMQTVPRVVSRAAWGFLVCVQQFLFTLVKGSHQKPAPCEMQKYPPSLSKNWQFPCLLVFKQNVPLWMWTVFER